MAAYSYDTSDQIVDTCMQDLGADAPQLDLLRCVTAAHATELGQSFWQFSRNVLLVYSVSESVSAAVP